MIFPAQPTTQLILLNSLLVVILILLSWGSRVKPYMIPKQRRVLGWVLLFLCMMFPFYDIDFFNYIELMDVLKGAGSNLESIRGEILQTEWPYYYIGKFVNYNYILFRLVVWGGAMALYGFTMRRLKINPSVFILFFTIIALLLISYGRVTLAWAIAFWGYSFLIKPIESHKKIVSYVLGVCLIVFSVNFHKTAVLLPLAFALSTIKFNKALIVILLIAFPFLVQLADSQVLLNILNMSQDESDILNVNTSQYYLASDSGSSAGIAAKLQNILRYFVFYGFLLICVITIFNKQGKQDKFQPVEGFMNVSIWLIYISSIFAFTSSANTGLVYYRFLNFAVFPMTLVLSEMIVNGQQRKLLNLITYCAVFYTIYRLLYALYLAN